MSFKQSCPKPLTNSNNVMANFINILPAISELPSSECAALQSPPTTTPATTLISDVDLLRCTRHIHENISVIAGSLGISSKALQEIKNNYEEVETQAYWVLKKWQESVSSNIQQQDLHDKLQVLGFHNAAERYLCLLLYNIYFCFY